MVLQRVLSAARLSSMTYLKGCQVQISMTRPLLRPQLVSAIIAKVTRVLANQIQCPSFNASSRTLLRPPPLVQLQATKHKVFCHLTRCRRKSKLLWQTCLNIVLQQKVVIPHPFQSSILTPPSVVFSFWTLTLDLVQQMLNENEITYTRIDGKTSLAKRTECMRLFQTDDTVRVILVSITCGGAG